MKDTILENRDKRPGNAKAERAELVALIKTLTPSEIERVIFLARQLLDPQ